MLKTTRDEFLALFPSPSAAIEFEQQVLSIGRALLPPPALTVLDGGEATSEYWAWLIGQVE